MPSFRYEAKQSPTQTLQGVIVAENKKFAIDQINQLGLYVLSIKEVGAAEALSTVALPRAIFFRSAGLKETTDFSRGVGDLLESGIPLVRALELLESQMTHKKMKAAVQDIKEQCVGGASLSAALGRHPEIFSNISVVLTRAGETGGTLDQSLHRLSVFGEKQLEIHARIRAALAYPALMACVGILTVLVLLIFVIPRMQGIFSDLGHSLPLPTQALLFISSILTRHFFWFAALCAALSWGAWSFYTIPKGKRFFDKIKLDLPLFGILIKKIEIARFSQTLGTLLENGVAILEALKTAIDTAENILIREELESCVAAVKGGERLSAALSKSRLIPPVMLQMISVGEESGRLEKTLQKLSENYERESDQSIKLLMSLLEPTMILTLGLIVGFMVIAILLPIFEISLSAR